ncbi:MAG: ABC transporter transmembrane domain-containing protein [Nitrospinota bacterium]|nr:ABC transporter transmembrane domain-containing protein [Nitrospinota bacterium]
MTALELYKRLLQFLLPYRGKVLLAIFCSVVVGVIATSPVPLIQKTFDDIFQKKDFFMLKMIPLALVALFLIKGVFSYIQNIIIYGISWELVVSLRAKMFLRIQRLPLSFFEETPTGQLISRIINDVSIAQSSITNLVKEFLQNAFMLFGLVSWLFYLKWDWALLALVIFPLAVFPIANIARKLRRLSRRGQEIISDIHSTILESFSAIKIVRAFSLENRQVEKLGDQNNRFLEVMKKNVKYIEIPSPFMEFLGVVSGALILWYGGYQVLTDQVTQGIFLGFIVALFMMYGPIRLLFKIYTNFQSSLAGAERIFFVLDQEEEDVEGGQRELTGFADNIVFRDVSFRYPSRDAWVLKDINLTVKKSEIIAVVGMSGAGKTTLVDLLFRFFQVTEGQIWIDGVDIQEFSVQSLRKNLALVTQETFLFNDTIRNNIAFGETETVTEDKIIGAAKAAHVDVFAESLVKGYDTIIGERGVKLSGGQRQRIAIARAILRDASILVLDEATSSLDSESEKLVQDALNHLMENRTTFVIAHRLSTIKHADRIIVVDDGRIVEEGSHEELLAHCGIYQKYYEMQFVDVPHRN